MCASKMTKETSGTRHGSRRGHSNTLIVNDNSTNNVHDNIKALEEMRLDAEKGMFMFDGAIQLLARQQVDSASQSMCAICKRELDSKSLLQQCTRLLQTKQDSVRRLRNEEALTLHESCVAAISEIGSSSHEIPCPNAPRLAFYLRTGELSEWRQQKMDCMTNMTCFACSRSFAPEEFSAFLKRVDHRAAVMERELHVHPKFYPVPAGTRKQVNHHAEEAEEKSASLSTKTKRTKWTHEPSDNSVDSDGAL